MVNSVPFDDRRQVVHDPQSGSTGLIWLLEELRLDIKLERYLRSQKMVCIVALSTRQLTFLLIVPNYKLIESFTWIKKTLFN